MRWTSEEIAWCCCSRRAVCNSTQIIGIGEESTDFRHFKHVKITETGVSSLNSVTHSRMVSPIWSFSIAKALCSFNVCSTSEAASGELNASSSDWKTADYAMMKKWIEATIADERGSEYNVWMGTGTLYVSRNSVETTLGVSSRSTESEVDGRVAALKSNWEAVWSVRVWIRSMIRWRESGWRLETREQKRKVTCFQRIVRIVGVEMDDEEEEDVRR